MNNINQEERAYRTWEILIAAAKNGETLRYGDLGSRLGVHPRALYWPLDLIHQYCIREDLPPLTILVVNATGYPGEGFTAWDRNHFKEGFDYVFGHAWELEDNPFSYAASGATGEMLSASILNSTAGAEDLYQRVKVRGAAQEIFRTALLDAYRNTCAMCDLSIPEALDAAHIKPWAASVASERLDVRNGLLLCRNHHALFDNGMITIDTDFAVIVHWEARSRLESLEGRRLSLPQHERHWPSSVYLKWHREKTDVETI